MPVLLLVISLLIFSLVATKQELFDFLEKPTNKIQNMVPRGIIPSPLPKITLKPFPPSKILTGGYHTFQTFNNCGPAALSMTLSYFGINTNQQDLGNQLRPYQIASGDNDDKSVTLEELAEKSKEFGLVAYHRPNGDIETIKNFINYDIPTITRTWTKPNEDIGHYRVVKGYDESIKSIIQDDSLQNKNLWFAYDDFNAIWQKFNFEYLVIVPQDKVEIAEAILEENANEQVAWQNAIKNAEAQLAKNPNDTTARFNLSVALYHIGNYQESAYEFEKVKNLLPFRTLWYQIEPIQTYYELGNFDRVLQITNRILANGNRAFSELYVIRGNIYKNQGNLPLARSEFEKAVFYNQNLKEAKQALSSL